MVLQSLRAEEERVLVTLTDRCEFKKSEGGIKCQLEEVDEFGSLTTLNLEKLSKTHFHTVSA